MSNKTDKKAQVKFEKALQQVEAKVDAEIASGKTDKKDRAKRIEFYVNFVDTKGQAPGMVEWYAGDKEFEAEPEEIELEEEPEEETEIPDEKEDEEDEPEVAPKKRGRPKKSNSSPKKKVERELPSLTADWIEVLVNDKKLDAEKLTELYWETFDSGAVDDYEGDFKVMETIQLCLAEVTRWVNAAKIPVTFTPISVGEARGFEGEIPISPGSAIKKKGMVWKNDAFGWITTPEGNFLCSARANESEDGSKSIASMEPWSTYTADTEQSKRGNLYTLWVNEAITWEKVGEEDPSDSTEMLKELIEKSPYDVIDVSEVTAEKIGKGLEIIARGRIIEVYATKKAKDGRSFCGVSLTTTDQKKIIAGYTDTLTFNVWGNPEWVTSYGKNSTIIISAWVKPGKGSYAGTLDMNIKWIAPIDIRGVPKTVNTVSA